MMNDAVFADAVNVLALMLPDEDDPNVRLGERTAGWDGGLADGIVLVVVEIECNATLLALVLECHCWPRKALSLKMIRSSVSTTRVVQQFWWLVCAALPWIKNAPGSEFLLARRVE
jgi:hypothetical protein